MGGIFQETREPQNRRREHGGEGGIRTHGRGKPTHAFQACALNRSATSPAMEATSPI